MDSEIAGDSMLKSLRAIVQEVVAARDLADTLRIIVRRVRETMGTEVCSVYIRDRDTGRYVFMATEGLNQGLEGNFSLAPDEGLVGYVARREEPVNLDDAESHPRFKYIEGSGEELFKSFLGVPIIHHRDVVGVLVVQQRERRRFDEDDEAFLITMSAQLAGVVAHAGVTGAFASRAPDAPQRMLSFPGIAGAPGIAIGTAVVVTAPSELRDVPERDCDDIEAEVAFFELSLQQVIDEINATRDSLEGRVRPEELGLFDAYVLILEDGAMKGEVIERIRRGSWAQGALSAVVLEHVRAFEMMDDPYIRDRAADLRDLGGRVLAALQLGDTDAVVYPEQTVLVGEEIPPALLAAVPQGRLAAIVSVGGSGNSHVAILARAMGIPTVMGAVDLPFAQFDGDEMVVDGHNGQVLVNVRPEVLAQYRQAMQAEHADARELEGMRHLASEMADGHPFKLVVNTGLNSEYSIAIERGAEGVGLFRTEVPFLMRERFPTEEEQRAIYREQLAAFAPRPVTMRTLDVGGDKSLPYFPIEEENPFLGWRGIRVTLDHPEIFLAQVRAMMKASLGLDNLRVMLPMVSSVGELDEALGLLHRAHAEVREEGWDVQMPPVGVMVEVPSAVYQARALARRADFLSVGSNDLTQYLLAVDRNNARVASLYHAFHPAVLGALEAVAQAAHAEGKRVSICGELAGDAGAALLLVAMDYDALSMSSINLTRVKAVLRRFTRAEAVELLHQVRTLDHPEAVRACVEERLQARGVTVRTRRLVTG